MFLVRFIYLILNHLLTNNVERSSTSSPRHRHPFPQSLRVSITAVTRLFTLFIALRWAVPIKAAMNDPSMPTSWSPIYPRFSCISPQLSHLHSFLLGLS